MPQFTIQTPDGRAVDVEADDENAALAGVKSWWSERAGTGTPLRGSGIDPLATTDDVTGQRTPSPAEGSRAAAEMQGHVPERGPMRYLSDLAEKIGQGYFANYGDEIAATAGALPHWLSFGYAGKSRDDILDDIRRRERVFEEEHPTAATVGELTGAVGAGLTGGAGAGRALLGPAPGVMRSMGAGALTAAPLGALSATGRLEGEHTAGEYGTAALEGGAEAGTVGALVGGGGNAASRIVGPIARPLARRLSEMGVRLTPGELVGGGLERLENNLAAVPIIGDLIRGRAREGVESLNRAAYREGLMPLGRRYANMFTRRAGQTVGHESIEAIDDILEHRYQTVVPRLIAHVDAPLIQEAQAIGRSLPDAALAPYRDAIRRFVDDAAVAPVGGNAPQGAVGTLTGTALQQTLRGLRDEGNRLMQSTAHPYYYNLGRALHALRDRIIDAAGRYSAPRDVTAFRNVNNAYARYVRLRDAASRVSSDEGVFSPAILHNAVRAQDRSVGKGASSQGRAIMQNLSTPAKMVMRPKGAGSPTAERLTLLGLLANPKAASKVAIAGIPAAMLYSPTGTRAFQAWATTAPAARELIRNTIRTGTGYAAPAAGVVSERPQGRALAHDAMNRALRKITGAQSEDGDIGQ